MFETILCILSIITIVLGVMLYIHHNYIKYLRKQTEEEKEVMANNCSKTIRKNIEDNIAQVKLEKEKYGYLETIMKLMAYRLPTLFKVNSEIGIMVMDYAAGFELHFTGPSYGKEPFPRMFYKFFANRESRPELHIQLTDNQVFNDIFASDLEDKFKGNGQTEREETEVVITQSFQPDSIQGVHEVFRVATNKYQKLLSSIQSIQKVEQ